MARKQVLFRSGAREKILRGAAQLADAVPVTLGPRSKSVLIETKWGPPIVCNDGFTIAKEFDLKGPEENLGARMLRQASATAIRISAGNRCHEDGLDRMHAVLRLIEHDRSHGASPVKLTWIKALLGRAAR